MKLHKLLFYILLFSVPLQTRILLNADESYVSWYFDYHLAMFLYATDLLYIGIMASWLIFDRSRLSKIADSKLYSIILGFLILILVTLFHVKRIDLGVYSTFKWIEVLSLILYIRSEINRIADFKVVLGILFVSGILQAILGWFQFHVQHMIGLKFLGEYIATSGTAGLSTIDTVGGKVIRAYGTFPHPNVLGAYLVASLTAALYIVSSAFTKVSADKHGTKWIKGLSVIGTSMLMFGLFTTFSRNAWLAAAIILVSFGIYYLAKKQYTALVTVALITIVSCATIFSLYRTNLQARISSDNTVSVGDRYFFNQMGVDMIKKFPSLGVGAGNYVVAQQDLFVLEPWQYQPPHNIFIFVGAELGILGLGLFIMILYEIFQHVRGFMFEILPFTLILLGLIFLLMGQFDHYFATIQQGRLTFAIVLGLISALPNLNAQNPKFNDQKVEP
jgi:hypothetical protein